MHQTLHQYLTPTIPQKEQPTTLPLSGQQLRKMPSYDIDGSTKYNYDDRPQVEDPCTKNYPSVSFGGFGYLFLWFCPVHGHSYGFHLIKGGRDTKILLVLYSST